MKIAAFVAGLSIVGLPFAAVFAALAAAFASVAAVLTPIGEGRAPRTSDGAALIDGIAGLASLDTPQLNGAVDALGPITASSEFKDRVAAASIPSRTGGTVADTRTSEEITAAENAAKTITAGHFVDRATAVANSIETVKKVTLFSAKLHAKAHKVNSAKMELLWKRCSRSGSALAPRARSQVSSRCSTKCFRTAGSTRIFAPHVSMVAVRCRRPRAAASALRAFRPPGSLQGKRRRVRRPARERR